VANAEYQQLVQFLQGQFPQIEGRFTQIEGRFTHIEGRFTQNDRRFDGLETELRAFRGEVLGHFDEIYRRLERLEQEYFAITQALRRIETLLADEQRRREVIEESVADLKRQVTAIQARIAELEARLRQ